MGDPNGEPTPEDAAMFDEVAPMTAGDDLTAVRERYATDAAFTVPPVILTFVDNTPHEADLTGVLPR